MAFQFPAMTDPQDPTAAIAAPYARIIFFALDFATATGRIVLGVYRSKGARDANLQNVFQQIAWTLTPAGTPARDAGNKPLTTADGGATWQDAQGQTVTPTYAAIPGVPTIETILDNPLANGVSPKALLYGIITQQPEIPVGATPLLDS